jgi:hypothetical protein
VNARKNDQAQTNALGIAPALYVLYAKWERLSLFVFLTAKHEISVEHEQFVIVICQRMKQPNALTQANASQCQYYMVGHASSDPKCQL